MPEISVIVPVYNVEKYLANCLESILHQTFSDMEVICVNDGSIDRSRKILTKYAAKDRRIKIIDKENGGLSSARNAGLKVAQGKYISFIDSDDWVESTMLEKLYNSMESLNTDIAICGVHQYDESKKETDSTNLYFNLGYFDERFDNRAFSYEETLPFLMNVCVMAWNKLYRRSFLEELKAEFPDGYIFEDGPFFFSIYFKTKRVSIVRDLLYYYRINRKGSIIQRCGKKYIDIIKAVELMYNALKEIPEFDGIKDDFYCEKANDIVYRYDLSSISRKKVFAEELKKQTYLFDEKIFNFEYIKSKAPITYSLLNAIKEGRGRYYYLKILVHHITPEYVLRHKLLNKVYDKVVHHSIPHIIYLISLVIRFFNVLFHYKLLREFIMKKVIEILYFEEGVYYFKVMKFIRRVKKRPKYYDIWYLEDRIYVVLFSKIKFDFKFEFSKLEEEQKKKRDE